MIPVMFKALWRYRGFVISCVRNEYRGRFARSAFGGLWAFLNPLAEVAIYALILSNVLAARFDGIDSNYSFAIYLTSGILAWSLFANVINRSLHLFIASGDLIKKVHFPKVVLPATVAGVAIVDNLFLAVAIAGVFAILGHFPGIYVLWLPVLMLVTLVFAISIGLILGILNVFIRDIGQVVPIALQFGFWLTPIVYPLHIIPERWRHWLMLNPMIPILEAYQSILAFVICMRAGEEMADVL